MDIGKEDPRLEDIKAENARKLKELDAIAKGERYFEIDPGYDKRVYVSDCANVTLVIAIIIVYYGLNIIWWWGMTSFGLAFS